MKRLQSKFQLLLDENQNLSTEKELKLIPRIEQLLRENAAFRNGTAEGQDVDGLLVQNDFLLDQVKQLKQQAQGGYKSRQERADLLLQLEQFGDEREDLIQKAVNLKQSLKTLKAELLQRENIADSLKKQNRELRHTLNLMQ